MIKPMINEQSREELIKLYSENYIFNYCVRHGEASGSSYTHTLENAVIALAAALNECQSLTANKFRNSTRPLTL